MNIREQIHDLRNQGKSIPEICDFLKVGKGNVGYYLKDYVGNFKGKQILPKYRELRKKYKNEIIKLYKNQIPIKHISNKLKLSQNLIKNILIEENIYKRKNKIFDFESLLKGEVKYSNPSKGNGINNLIKRYLLKNNIKENKCEICKINKWNNKPINMDLDHIDGDRDNNKLENLRLICPNCHSQTDTYKGKRKKYVDIS